MLLSIFLLYTSVKGSFTLTQGHRTELGLGPFTLLVHEDYGAHTARKNCYKGRMLQNLTLNLFVEALLLKKTPVR